jgi:hypothetical protein
MSLQRFRILPQEHGPSALAGLAVGFAGLAMFGAEFYLTRVKPFDFRHSGLGLALMWLSLLYIVAIACGGIYWLYLTQIRLNNKKPFDGFQTFATSFVRWGWISICVSQLCHSFFDITH